MPETKKATLKSISSALNISKTTVSLVLKGEGSKYRISRETQKRILNYAESVNFEPDFLAKALATSRTSTVGLIFPDVHETFMSEMVRGIEAVLYAEGFSIILSTSGFSTEIEMRNIQQLIRHRVDGIIIVPYIPVAHHNYAHGYLKTLKQAGCPVIFVDRLPSEKEGLNWVVQDDFNSARQAVKIMHDRGCRNIGCISFDLDASSIKDRIAGLKKGLADSGLKWSENNLLLLQKQDDSGSDLYKGVKKMLSADHQVDGLIVTTGGLAHKLYYLSKTADLNLNGIQIVKYGKDPEYFSSNMSRIIQPNTEMAKKAAEIIIEQLKNKPEQPVQAVIKSRIVTED